MPISDESPFGAAVSDSDGQSLLRIFHPTALARQKEMQASGRRFVHYTSADAAAKIIRSKSVWLRNVRLMNDYSEIQHGLDCLIETWRGDAGKAMQLVLEDLYPGSVARFEQYFNAQISGLRHESYIICLSEHMPAEDVLGRLSMWRAYGRSGGVALVLNTVPFFGESDALASYTTPVEYISQADFELKFRAVGDEIDRNRDLLKSFSETQIIHYLSSVFRFAAISTKHPGFREEREWRVVHNPTIQSSTKVKCDIETLNGIPQPIYKINLENDVHAGLHGLAMDELLDRIIIGPTEYSGPMRRAFCDLLRSAEISNPEDRVFVSHIPVR